MIWQLLAVTSALFSALAAVLEKKALFKMHPLGFSLILSAFTFVLSLPFFMHVNFDAISVSAVLVLYIKSVLGAAAFLLVMHGIKRNELSNSLPLLVLTPGIVAVVAYFILGESLGTYSIFGMILLLAGTYFLQLEKHGKWFSPFLFVKRNKSYWFIIAALLLFSTTSILDKSILKNYKLQPEAFIPIQQFFFTINFFLLYAIKPTGKEKLKEQLSSYWKIILAVAVCAVIYRYSHILAVKSGSVALVLSIKRTSVFFAAVIGGKYFHEHNLLRRSIAVTIMVLGAVIVVLF